VAPQISNDAHGIYNATACGVTLFSRPQLAASGTLASGQVVVNTASWVKVAGLEWFVHRDSNHDEHRRHEILMAVSFTKPDAGSHGGEWVRETSPASFTVTCRAWSFTITPPRNADPSEIVRVNGALAKALNAVEWPLGEGPDLSRLPIPPDWKIEPAR
jgi:hypothetical protein